MLLLAVVMSEAELKSDVKLPFKTMNVTPGAHVPVLLNPSNTASCILPVPRLVSIGAMTKGLIPSSDGCRTTCLPASQMKAGRVPGMTRPNPPVSPVSQ